MADILKWARDRKRNVASIANKTQGVYHQVNPFDGGRTFDTNQRGVSPGTPNPVNIKSDDTPGFQWTNNSLTRGLSRGYDQANILDNGLSWKQRVANTDNSVVAQAAPIGKAIVKAPAQMLNTAGAQIPQAYYTLAGQVADWTNNEEALANALEMQRYANENFDDTKGGLFNVGTFYNQNSAEQGDLEGVKDIIGGTIQTAATVAPFAKGGSLATLAGTKPLAAKTAILGAEGAAYGGAYSTGSQLQDKGTVDGKQVLKDAALGGAFGAALPVVGAGAKGGLKVVTNKVGPETSKLATKAAVGAKDGSLKVRAASKPMGAISDVVKKDKTFTTLDKRVTSAVENASNSTGALKANYRQEAVELIRLRNARVRELTQGGYVNPGAMADDAKNAMNKIKGKVSSKVDEGRTYYHGTDGDFDNFDLNRFGQTDEGFLGKGVYLTSEKDIAKDYGSKVIKTKVKLDNPLSVDDPYAFGGVHPNSIKKKLGLGENASPALISKTLKEKGYDGVVINKVFDNGDRIDGIEVLVVDPSKVKKVTKQTPDEIIAKDKKLIAAADKEIAKSQKMVAEIDGTTPKKTKISKDFGTDDQYVYHADATNSPVDKFAKNGIKPSKTGQSGPGVYLANAENATQYNYSSRLGEKATMYRVDKQALVKKFGKYPANKNGVQFDESTGEILLDGKRNIPPEFLEVKGADGNWSSVVPKDTRKLLPGAQNKPRTRVLPTKTEPTVKNTRFATKTVQGSQEVSEKVKKSVKEADNSYTMVTNKEQLARSEKFIKKNNIRKATADVKERLNAKDIDNQTVSDSIAVAKKLDAKGGKENLIASSEIYEQLSKKLTEAGQTVQAASLLNNRTPDGMKYWAISQLKKKGVTLAPDKAKKLEELIRGVRNAKPDTYDAGYTRFKVAEFVAKNSPHDDVSKAIQIWKAGLLTSPRTTAGNLFANTAETIFKKGWVDPVATVFDKVMSLKTGARTKSMTLRGMATGGKEGAIKGVRYFKTGYDPRNPDIKWDIRNIHYSDKPLGKAAEKYTQSVFRLMGAQDQPFYYANMRNSLYDQAVTAAKNQKLKGAARQKFIKKFVTEPTKDALELADAEGRYAVFQNPTALGKAASRLKSADGAVGNISEFIMPFSGVPSSIATRIIERTPLGLAVELVKQYGIKGTSIKGTGFNQRAMAKAIANGTAVVPLIGAGKALAESGNMTLAYPKDKNERELWEAEGKQPYSIKLPGGNEWLSLNYFQPGGAIISAGAEYQNALDEGKTSSEALAIATAGAGKAFTEQSFLKGVSGGLNALTDPTYAGAKFIDSTAGSLTPNFIRATATASDDKQRQANTVLDRMKTTIPGLRQTLDPKRDLFGRDVPERTSAPHALLNPLRPSRVNNADDPTTSEIRRLTDADQGVTPTQIKKDAFYDKKTNTGTKLTDKQVQDFNAEVGAAVKVEWDKIMENPKYNSMDDEEKSKLLRKVNEDTYGALKRKYEADNQLGEYAADYTGKETKLSTNEKRYLEGKSIDYYSKDSSERTPIEEYEYQKEKFEEEKDSYNDIERAQKQQEIQKLGIKKDYDELTTDLYDLNKDDAYDYVTGKGAEGEALFMQAVEYGDKLVEAGLIDKNKWRDKYGNIVFESSSSKAKKAKKPWQAPTTQAIKQSRGADNRELITSVSGIKARRTRRKFA